MACSHGSVLSITSRHHAPQEPPRAGAQTDGGAQPIRRGLAQLGTVGTPGTPPRWIPARKRAHPRRPASAAHCKGPAGPTAPPTAPTCYSATSDCHRVCSYAAPVDPAPGAGQAATACRAPGVITAFARDCNAHRLHDAISSKSVHCRSRIQALAYLWQLRRRHMQAYHTQHTQAAEVQQGVRHSGVEAVPDHAPVKQATCMVWTTV